MRIGIDISQLAFPNTGVANYLENLVLELIQQDSKNEYILFFSSLRRTIPQKITGLKTLRPNVTIKTFKYPPSFLSLLWNNLHIMPIETFLGDIDVFLSSDWAEPPAKKAKKITILYDLIVFKYPQETHNKTSFSLKSFSPRLNIVTIQKKKLFWSKKECSKILCISQSTKKDAEELLGIEKNKLEVIYPGITL